MFNKVDIIKLKENFKMEPFCMVICGGAGDLSKRKLLPTIYHLFYDLFGLDWSFLKFLNSFGFFVALAFIAASWTLSRELRRKENEGFLQPIKTKVIIVNGFRNIPS